jgi:hypothetical protein
VPETIEGIGAYFDGHAHYCDNSYYETCHKYERNINRWVLMASPKTLGWANGPTLIPSSESKVKFPTAPGLNYGWPGMIFTLKLRLALSQIWL